MTGGRGPAVATLVLSSLMVIIGVALVIRALAGGGGPLAVGVVVGVLFLVAGLLRLYAERRRQ